MWSSCNVHRNFGNAQDLANLHKSHHEDDHRATRGRQRHRNVSKKKQVMLLLGIKSAVPLVSRRATLRKTWLQHCKPPLCDYRFLVRDSWDGKEGESHNYEPSLNNSMRGNMPDEIWWSFPRGINSALLWLLAVDYLMDRVQYSFDHFLYVDDDVFLCVPELIAQLQLEDESVDNSSAARLMYTLGWMHCESMGSNKAVWLDEAWFLSSAALVADWRSKFKLEELDCTDFGDQAFADWTARTEEAMAYALNHVVLHYPTRRMLDSIVAPCSSDGYLAIHHLDKADIERYWQAEVVLGQGRDAAARMAHYRPLRRYKLLSKDRSVASFCGGAMGPDAFRATFCSTSSYKRYCSAYLPCHRLPLWYTYYEGHTAGNSPPVFIGYAKDAIWDSIVKLKGTISGLDPT